METTKLPYFTTVYPWHSGRVAHVRVFGSEPGDGCRRPPRRIHRRSAARLTFDHHTPFCPPARSQCCRRNSFRHSRDPAVVAVPTSGTSSVRKGTGTGGAPVPGEGRGEVALTFFLVKKVNDPSPLPSPRAPLAGRGDRSPAFDMSITVMLASRIDGSSGLPLLREAGESSTAGYCTTVSDGHMGAKKEWLEASYPVDRERTDARRLDSSQTERTKPHSRPSGS